MEISELINLIANVGFPVAISAYLLIRLEKQILTLTFSINKLNTIISTKLRCYSISYWWYNLFLS